MFEVVLKSIKDGKSIIKNIDKPIIENIDKPIIENIAKPIIENIDKPIIENIAKPIIENIDKPIIENITKPIIENIDKPIIENIAEPIKYKLLDLKNTTKTFNGAFGCNEFIETFNPIILKHIINNWDNFKDDAINDNEKSKYNPLKQLKDYYKSSNNSNKVKSTYTKSKKSINAGRWYISPYGLQVMPISIKNAICKDCLIDIDIVNCHPVILKNICGHYNIKCPLLGNYVNNRDETLNDIMKKIGCNKSESKIAIIECLNGSKKIYKSDLLEKLKLEFKTIADTLAIHKDFEKIAKIVNKDENVNINHKITSRIINIYENSCLENTYLYLKDKEIIKNDIVVLSFDGLMVEDNIYNKNTLTPDFLNEISLFINEKVGIKLDFVIKPIISKLEIPENITDDPVIIEDSYEIIKTKHEDRYCKITDTANFAYKQSNNNWVYYSQSQVINNNANLYYSSFSIKTGEWERKLFIYDWIKDENILTFDKLEYDPAYKMKNIKNTFTGFPINLINAVADEDVNNKIKKIKYHIDNVICADNGGCPMFLYYYLANILQNPDKKTGVAILIKGIDGSGKSNIFEWFIEYIIGINNASKPGKISDVFSQFSPDAIDKLLILVDELNLGDVVKDGGADKLKNLITSKTLTYEQKGQMKTTRQNLINLIATSNNKVPTVINENDRRWTVYEANPQYIGNTDYFNNLYEELENEQSQRAFYQYLMNIDISHIKNFQAIRPRTKAYLQIVQRNLSAFDRYLSSFVNDCINYDDLKPIKTATSFYLEAKGWYETNGFKTEITSTAFGANLNEYINTGAIVRKKSGSISYFIDINKLKSSMIKNKTYDNDYNASLLENDDNVLNDDEDNNKDINLPVELAYNIPKPAIKKNK